MNRSEDLPLSVSEDDDSSSSSSSGDSSSGSESSSEEEGKQISTTSNQMDVQRVPVISKTLAGSNFTPNDIMAMSKSKSNDGLVGGKSKVVACGTVVNDRVRVVPIKKQTSKNESSGKGRLKQVSAEKKNKDPDFRPNGKVSSISSFGNVNGEGTPISDVENPSSSSTQRSLRTRTVTPILNENYIFRVQHSLFLEEAEENRKKNAKKHHDGSSSKGKTSAKGRGRQKKGGHNSDELDDQLDVELDGDGPPTFLRKSGKTADWDDYLKNLADAEWIAPVSFFKHAPFSQDWADFALVGTKVEVPNPFICCNRIVYWVATVKAFVGYKALVEYETFGKSPEYFSWISFCSDVPKPIGWCDMNNVLLFPPYEVYNKNKDFLKKLKKILELPEVKTVRDDHYALITKELLSQRRFSIMEPVEAIDGLALDRNRVGDVTGLIGDRVFVSFTVNKEDPGFWFNSKADRVHKIGWSQTVGYNLAWVPKKVQFPTLDPLSFPQYPEGMKVKQGMVFEVIHPVELNRIAAACVELVLKFGYFIARIESDEPYASVRFCFHVTSHWLLPCGFASLNNIPLIVPRGENQDYFEWESYCTRKHARRLDFSHLLPRPCHKFTLGCKLEAIDLRQPSFCGPATVIQVAEHLLQLHFDGWPRHHPQALQWVEAESPDIYPAGWAEMVGHEFQSRPEPPHIEDNPGVAVVVNEVSGMAEGNDGDGPRDSSSQSDDK